MKKLNKNNFKETIDGNNYILVDFWAEWCGPCRMIGPVIDEMSKEYEGKALIGKVDSDANWLIIRYTTTGVVLKSEYANGSEAFNQVWNNRATLTYI